MKAQTKDHTAKDTRIMACSCRHEYQDRRYGQGQRVHNPRKEGKYACTVCDNIKST